MLADKVISVRDEYICHNHAQAIATAYDKCLDDIEACVIAGLPIAVRRHLLELPEVVRSLSYIGFTIGEEFDSHNPALIGCNRKYLTYLVPT
jgi:hypothetical protein